MFSTLQPLHLPSKEANKMAPARSRRMARVQEDMDGARTVAMDSSKQINRTQEERVKEDGTTPTAIDTKASRSRCRVFAHSGG